MKFQKNDAYVVNDDIWVDYAKSRDVRLRNQILESYLYIVSTNIKRMSVFLTNNDDIEDITNQGVLELINCIERYDYKRGIQFDTYASIRIRGSIIDYIRKKNWVPRDARKRVKMLNECEAMFQSRHGRQPTDKELAEQLGTSEDEIQKIRMDELNYNVLAFEDLIQNNGVSLIEEERPVTTDTPEEKLLNDEFKKVLAKCIDRLDKNEKTVISLYYYEELKLKEIAFVMNLTPSRISQIHSKALSKLKEGVTKYLIS